MYLLLLAIISSTAIFVCFKYLEKFKVDILAAIIINYIVATICGILLSPERISLSSLLSIPWFKLSLVIGVLFIVMFFIIGLSSQKAGIAVTTLASKMSFIIPMLFSILYYHESISALKTFGIILAVLAVILGVWKRNSKSVKKQNVWLPLVLFVGAGLVDSLVKYAQDRFLTSQGTEQFSTVLFAIAGLSGFLFLILMGKSPRLLTLPKNLLSGTILGIANFGSLFFLIASLNQSGFDSSVVFSIVNMGIVSLSLFLGLSLFREKLTFTNALGIVLAFIAIFILTNL